MATCDAIPYRIQEAEVALALSYTTEPGSFPVLAVEALLPVLTSSVKSSARLKSNTTNTPALLLRAITATTLQSSPHSRGCVTSLAAGWADLAVASV